MFLALSLTRPGLGAAPWGRGAAAGRDAARQRRSRVGKVGDTSVKSGKYYVPDWPFRGILPGSDFAAALVVARCDSAVAARNVVAIRDSNRLSAVGLSNCLNFHKSISLDG